MPPGFLDDFFMWYESTIEEYGADFLVRRPLLHLVVGIPPRLFREVGSPAPALKLVLELRLATLTVSIDEMNSRATLT